jgi:hypothetical protein
LSGSLPKHVSILFDVDVRIWLAAGVETVDMGVVRKSTGELVAFSGVDEVNAIATRTRRRRKRRTSAAPGRLSLNVTGRRVTAHGVEGSASGLRDCHTERCRGRPDHLYEELIENKNTNCHP